MTPRIAVVGCGQWGRNHIRTLDGLGALSGVADVDTARAEAFAAQYGVPAYTAEAAIAAPDLDALVLAMPAHLHGETARAAFAAGKDVLIEKPIGLDARDAAVTRAAAAKAGRILMVGHVLRFHPVFQRLCGLVREGRIGTLRHIVSNRIGLGRFPTMDAVWDLAPHDLSLVLHLAGSHPVEVNTLRRTVLSDETDVADIALRFADDITAQIHISRVSPYRDRRFSAIGTAGMLVFDDMAPDGQKLAFYGHTLSRAAAGFDFVHAEPVFEETQTGLPLERELAHFIDCVTTRRPPETDGDEAVETVRILQLASPLKR
ncbi:Gfo/Idh/MocA family oxidoreductase [Aurantimonas sp. Leaf443]|uniref:Gfo/Idh/MocA family protein n=1 Tax=Aurantimonas sp. Leaf443 TaxID=1736378 RepID=UPI0006F4A5B3|nr:Gfo/Idh/MocA family oxidoreductase [Aurantimonas sp. Leaf443]KQT88169.1 oxidoreductase [Aurantimonas sp. Leaf443]